MSEGGKEAVRVDDDVVGANEVRRLRSAFVIWNGYSAARPWRWRSSRKLLNSHG